MPQYFFHTADGVEQRDYDGIELPNDLVAKEEATRLAGDLLSEEPGRLWNTQDFRVNVTDEDENPVAAIITIAVDA